MLHRERFLDVLRNQYVDTILEAYWECEHGPDRPIDFRRLRRKLVGLMRGARSHGLGTREFVELVRATLPAMDRELRFRIPVAA